MAKWGGRSQCPLPDILGCVCLGLLWNRNSWNDQNNRPLAYHGNAANLEDKTKDIFSSGNWDIFSCRKSYCSVLQIGCISTDVQDVYSSLQTCQNQLTVSLRRFYSHSGMRVAWEQTILFGLFQLFLFNALSQFIPGFLPAISTTMIRDRIPGSFDPPFFFCSTCTVNTLSDLWIQAK